MIEFFEERAAIMEFDGGLDREEAVEQAFYLTVKMFGKEARKVLFDHLKGKS